MPRHLHVAAPQILRREVRWGRGALKEVADGVRLPVASRTKVRFRNANGMAVRIEPGALARPQLGQGGTEVAWEGQLGRGDVGGLALQNSVWDSAGQVGFNGGSVDAADGGTVVGRVGSAVRRPPGSPQLRAGRRTAGGAPYSWGPE